jgi:signal transduction histidine kinase
MRRRLSLTMVLMVVGALVFAGLFTLGLTAADSLRQTENELATQAQELAHGLQTETGKPDPQVPLRTVVRVLKAPLRLQGAAVLGIRADGLFYDIDAPDQPVTLPSGLTPSQLVVGKLMAGDRLAGHVGRLAWAAAPFTATIRTTTGTARRVQLRQVVILTRDAPSGIAGSFAWFVLASGITIGVALLVANRLGHRIVAPLEDAQRVTGRIAAGDLEARVPEPSSEDPELLGLARSINAMADGLAASRGTQRQFLLSVSHELRTPLTSIRGYAEAVADGAAPDPARAATIIGGEARRLERLVGDLLELARIDSGAFNLRPVALDAAEVVADTADGFGPAARQLGLQLQVRADDPRPVAVHADPDRLGQVVANLTENALKYASQRVLVGVAHSAGIPVIWVEDDGPGIPAEDLPRVFERLYQSRSAPGRHVGSGLGLAIVRQLVTAMGGDVRAESPVSERGGTRMVVTLPPG